ncbi:MAG: helix-turn-helix transcriptional regulator [Candidatus Saccharimonadales bacterium]
MKEVLEKDGGGEYIQSLDLKARVDKAKEALSLGNVATAAYLLDADEETVLRVAGYLIPESAKTPTESEQERHDSLRQMGEFLRARRKEKHLSLRELGKLSGVSKSQIHNIESGYHPETGRPIQPTLKTLENLAWGLGVDKNELFAMAGYEASEEDEE